MGLFNVYSFDFVSLQSIRRLSVCRVFSVLSRHLSRPSDRTPGRDVVGIREVRSSEPLYLETPHREEMVNSDPVSATYPFCHSASVEEDPSVQGPGVRVRRGEGTYEAATGSKIDRRSREGGDRDQEGPRVGLSQECRSLRYTEDPGSGVERLRT